jgi:hypothetical protein
MSKAYHSFMIRFWRLSAGERRVVIQHLQTGEQARVLTLEAALAWLADRAKAASGVVAEGTADVGPEGGPPVSGDNPTPAVTTPNLDES